MALPAKIQAAIESPEYSRLFPDMNPLRFKFGIESGSMEKKRAQSKVELFIFDLDGTLVDSKKDIVLCVNRAFSVLGLPTFPEPVIGKEIGYGSERLFRQLLGQRASNDVISELQAAFRDFYAKHMTENTCPYPGVLEVLTHYSEVPKVVVTNKAQALADHLIDRLELRPHFKGVYGFEAFATQKPDPGPILGVCARWDVEPGNAMVVGDSIIDVTAGKKAGTRTVAVLYGFGAEADIRSGEPDFMVRSASEIIGLASSFRGSE